MSPQMNAQMNGQMNAQMNAQMNPQMNAQMNAQVGPAEFGGVQQQIWAEGQEYGGRVARYIRSLFNFNRALRISGCDWILQTLSSCIPESLVHEFTKTFWK